MKNEMNEKQVSKNTIWVNGVERVVNAELPVSEVLQDMQEFSMPCAGHGRCGKCKIHAVGELSEPNERERIYLTKKELENGIRLACQTYILGPCRILSFDEGKSEVILDTPKITLGKAEDSQALFHHLGAAVDIGTTTLAVALYDRHGLLGREGAVNPQVTFGADVISRIENSLQGEGEKLAQSVQSGIADLLKTLCQKNGYEAEKIDTLVITGNTVMLYLLTGKNPKALSQAPFVADWLAGEWISASDLELGCPNAKVYLPHCMSAFVGADITMALLNTDICRDKKKRLLVDIGTNGEVALWTGEKLLCCSTAAGPAFEGTGLSMGMTAKTGAISKVSWKKKSFELQVIGNTEPIGICGSGVIDAVSCLLQNGYMDETGYLEDEEVYISENVTLTQEDIRKVQLAKSAICSGIESVLNKEGITADDLDELLVAGGFGSKIDLNNATKMGLLPQMDVKKIKVCGNAALAGAEQLLCQSKLLTKEKKWIEISETLNLAVDGFFQERYIENMLFSVLDEI